MTNKLINFGLSAFFAGLSGGLYASYVGSISPEPFSVNLSVDVLTMLLVGGSGTIRGPAIGATFLVFLKEWLRFMKEYYMILYGAGHRPRHDFYALRTCGSRPSGREPVPLAQRVEQGRAVAALLRIENVSMRFGGLFAVSEVDLHVHPGEIRGLIGPNGAGKTTILNVINGIYRPTSGSIVFDTRNITGLSPHVITRLGIARTFQNIQVFQGLSVLENVMVARHIRSSVDFLSTLLKTPRARREEAEIIETALASLRFVGLEDRKRFRRGPLFPMDRSA